MLLHQLLSICFMKKVNIDKRCKLIILMIKLKLKIILMIKIKMKKFEIDHALRNHPVKYPLVIEFYMNTVILSIDFQYSHVLTFPNKS